jgi:3-deoxy-D-manno-octulosonic-acid transferase
MLLLYNLLSTIALLFYLPLLLFKKGPDDRPAFIRERLGISAYTTTDIWVHAVSVGETIACLPFLRRLKKDIPGLKITLSTTTYTGQKVAREGFPEAERIMYMPWDSGFCINRVIKALRPRIFATIDTEIWPLLIDRLRSSGARTMLLNGRISPGSYRGYRRLRFFMKSVLSGLDHLYMQSDGDAERIISIGADPEKVEVMGNFKFDIDAGNEDAPEWLSNINGHIFIAGSTHRGEDEIILDAFKDLNRTFPGLRLIIAPRHPERFDEVEELVRGYGLKLIRRTEITGSETRNASVILLDTVGELSRAFSVSDITFMGGSLLPYGGHNILEPAYWSNPIIFGPHMENFPFHTDFLDNSAAVQVRDSSDIIKAVTGLLNDPEGAKEMGKKARAIVEKNAGAVEKAVRLVRSYLGTS